MEKLKHFFNIVFVPTSFKPLKFILVMENIFCIYRNLTYYSDKCRIIIYLRILIEIIASILSVFIYTMYIVPITTYNELIFYYTNCLNSLIIILLACCYSKKFNKLLSLIENTNSCFSKDMKYQSNMRKRDRIIKGVLIVLISIIILNGFLGSYVRNTSIKYVTLNVLFTLNSRLCDCRNVFQYIALYSALYVISQQMEGITRAVKKKRSSVTIVSEQRDNISVEDFTEIRQETRDFEELSTLFSNIVECSKLFNEIYGLQLILMLGWATIYCIIFLYTMTFLSIKGFQDIGNLLGSLWKLVVFFLLVLLLSWSAQKKQNSARDLRRQLGTLLISSIDNDAEYKATKDFLCLVSTRSIQTKTFGSIDVDMTLIPSITMFITSYTVIALQFSNIV